MHTYTHKGILDPTPRGGLVHFADWMLTPTEARDLANELLACAEACDADYGATAIRPGQLT